MHNCELPAAGGAQLLLELSRLIVRSRDPAPPPPAPPPPDLPSTSKQSGHNLQPPDGVDAGSVGEAVGRAQRALLLDNQLNSHLQALWSDRVPICINVLLVPHCTLCNNSASVTTGETLLLERWTLSLKTKKGADRPAGLMTSQWLLNAVRSQLHFSQISAWRAKLHQPPEPQERQRRRSRETCNYKKLESNCDVDELNSSADTKDNKESRLKIVYRPGVGRDPQELSGPSNSHRFPLADVAPDLYLEVVLESIARTAEIPSLRCGCALSKRRPSRDSAALFCGAPPEDLAGRLNDLTLGPARAASAHCSTKFSLLKTQRQYTPHEYQDLAGSVQLDHPYSTLQNEVHANYLLVDDRMHTPCSESGKHRCSCDDESDAGRHDEKRSRELAKHKRRMRKEIRSRRISGPDAGEPTTSIPILQAARFDRMRALGCYRARACPAPGPPRTATVGTQTDAAPARCACGRPLEPDCAACRSRPARADAGCELARASRRREREPSAEQAIKKHKCDIECDAVGECREERVIKRPKLKRRAFAGKMERVVSDRSAARAGRGCGRAACGDMGELLLRDDDSVFAHMAPSSPPPAAAAAKRDSSTDDEVVVCDYGTFDRCDSPGSPDWDSAGSPVKDEDDEATKEEHPSVPSARATAGFRYRLDSAACMVFPARTGLPLTSSPAPLRRGTARFDYDSSISEPRHIRSALFHPVSPPEGWSSPGSSPGSPLPAPPSPPPPPAAAPVSPAAAARAPPRRRREPRGIMGSSTGLLGSFEESALKGRLEPVATVHGFTAELCASGAFCPPHRRLPVTVFFYSLGGTNAPYLGHINLGAAGYRVPRSGTIQVSLFNPHGTLVKMFVVLYELTDMPACARTFLRQRTLYLPCHLAAPPTPIDTCRSLRYLIHLRFLTSKTGKLYLHTDIRIIVSRKADLDTATAHIPINAGLSPATHDSQTDHKRAGRDRGSFRQTNGDSPTRVIGCRPSDNGPLANGNPAAASCHKSASAPAAGSGRAPAADNVSYELRSFTYAPDNPRYSPR